MKKTLSRIASFTLAVLCVFSVTITAFAVTSIGITGTPYYATMIKTGTGTAHKDVATGSTAWHNYGTNTVINVSCSKTVTANGFPSIYQSYFIQAGNIEGLRKSKSITLSYAGTVASSKPSGTYEIYATVNGNNGTWAVTTDGVASIPGGDSSLSYNPDGSVYSGTVTYAPTGTTITYYTKLISTSPGT